MSQGSNSSEESLTMSEGTFCELKEINGQDEKFIEQIDGEIDQHQDYRSYEPQPSCSYVDTSVFQNIGESSSVHGGFHHGTGSLPSYTVQPETVHRLQQILPKPAVTCVQVPSPSVLMLSLQSNIPRNQDYPGPFGFDIHFEAQKEPAPKASPWIFSCKLEKLFAKRKKDIPVRITLKVPPSPEILQFLSIRIVVMYSSIEHSRIVFQRCPNHAEHSESSGLHILETGNTDATYGTCQQTGQHVMTIPFDKLETGFNYKLEFIRFMCQNTCPGGPDRRPFHAVFTLLHNNEVCGIKTLKTKICSTPGRTRDNEEKNHVGMSRKVPASNSSDSVPKKRVKTQAAETRTETSTTRESDMSVNQGVPRMITEDVPLRIKQEDDDELFTIQVRGRKTYQYLMHVKEAIELFDTIPPEILERYRASCPPCGPNWHLQQLNQMPTVSGSQPMTPNVGITSTTTTSQDSTAVSTNTRYTLKNVLVQKNKAGSGIKSMKLKEGAT